MIEYLKDNYHVEIQLDKKALGDVGIASDTPVTKNLKGVSLRSALRMMLRELNLTYVIQDEVLLITTPEEAQSRLETKTYPVGDLVLPPGASGEGEADFDSLIDLLTSTVRPTTWDSVGGPGSISPFENGLSIVVSQTQEVQEEIKETLEQIRKVMRETGVKGLPAVKHRPKSEEDKASGAKGTMGGMGGMGGGMGAFGLSGRGEKGAALTLRKPNCRNYQKQNPSRETADDPFAAPKTSPERELARTVPQKTIYSAGQLKAPIVTSSIVADQSLVGMRSLKIDVVQTPSETERVLTFRSLGVEPQLTVTLVNQSRMSALGWGLALAVGLAGVAMTRRPARKKTVFILIVAIVATLLPLLTASIEVAQVCNMLFYAACLLAPYYLAGRLGAMGVRLVLPQVRMVRGALLLVAMLLAVGANAEPRRLRTRKRLMGRM